MSANRTMFPYQTVPPHSLSSPLAQLPRSCKWLGGLRLQIGNDIGEVGGVGGLGGAGGVGVYTTTRNSSCLGRI